jgi:hypothetical protein
VTVARVDHEALMSQGAAEAVAWLPSPPDRVPGEAEPADLAARRQRPRRRQGLGQSRKHEWLEAWYVPDLADTPHLVAVVARFVELQGEFLTGGVVLRAYEPYAPVAPAVRELGCRFVTTDLALREDGRWRVVEVGDGQVSGLPRGAAPDTLFETPAAADAP